MYCIKENPFTMKKLFLIFVFLICALKGFNQKKENKANFGAKVFYGPQISYFKIDNSVFSPYDKIFGIKKNTLGRSYGIDIELRNNSWIFGIGYNFNENKKEYNGTEGDISGYAIAKFRLRYTEAGVTLYVDKKINSGIRNDLFLGVGHVFSRGTNQIIETSYAPNGNLGVIIYSFPSLEAGLVPKLRWQHNWKQNVAIGMELKVYYLYSVDILTNTCFVPYLKVDL